MLIRLNTAFRGMIVACFLTVTAVAQHDGVLPESRPAAPRVDFVKDVKPILAQHCFSCHGPDEAKRKGGLRLDLSSEAFKVRENGAAFVASSTQKSLAFERIIAVDPTDRMPPEGKDALKPREIEIIGAWIEGGAEWKEHWAFVAPMRPAVPETKNPAWVKNSIDAFTLARLEKEGLTPSSEASREQWLRRVSLDLTGVPPTPEELDNFLAAKGADAYEKEVDRLLASPRYGERQASEWMDLARYADTSGYQRDVPRTAWKWREWVINAYNANMPFDRFTTEQLAGDLLPNATLDQRIATGFNRNHPTNTEAGEEEDEYRSAYIFDRIHATATTWLGLTLACAQCHDHKYDPLSQKDFYRFYGYFNNVKERDSDFGGNPKPSIPAPNLDQAPHIADLDRRIKALEARLKADDPLSDESQKDWEKSTLARIGAPIDWKTLDPGGMVAKQGTLLRRLDDGSILAFGPTPVRDTYEIVFAPGKRKIAALRIEVLPDPSMPKGALGRADDGRFILSSLEVRHLTVSDSEDPPLMRFALAAADINQEIDEETFTFNDVAPGSIEESIASDGDNKGFRFGGGGWCIGGEDRKDPHEAILIPLDAIDSTDVSVLRMTMSFTSREKFRSLIGRFRVSLTEEMRVRDLLVPVVEKTWSSLGPFPAETVESAHTTEFALEKDLQKLDLKKPYEQPLLPETKDDKSAGGAGKPPLGGKPGDDKKTADGGKPVDGAKPAEFGKPVDGGKPNPEAKPIAPESKPVATSQPSDNAGPTSQPVAKGEAPTSQPSPAKPEEKKKPTKLAWKEQPGWRNGSASQLSLLGGGTAWYLTRKIVSADARTVTIELSGAAGWKVWLNGESVFSEEPPPIREAADGKKEPSPGDDDFDFSFFMGRRGGASGAKTVRMGLRKGENTIVLKASYRGAAKPKAPGADGAKEGAPMMGMGEMGFGGPRRGGADASFTFALTPDGLDLLDYESMLALRKTHDEATSRPTSQPVPPTPIVAAGAAAAQGATTSQPVEAATSQPTTEQPTSRPAPETVRKKVLRKFYRTKIDPIGRAVWGEITRLKEEKTTLERKVPQAMVMEERPTSRPTHMFVRGQYKNKGERVSTGTPAVLPPPPAGAPANRLGLAQWILSPDNPLTARVVMNRLWQQYFGTGIVKTAEDFGIRSELPSHPELLDWLAVEFRECGWNLKKMHKAIVLSATYRQSSQVTPDLRERDPENRLLARGPRLRLTAEMIRDQALAASGLLFEKIGGPSVKPYQPPGLWRAVAGGGEWKEDKGQDKYRRALYTYWKRGVPYPSFITFDAAKRETCTVSRPLTTTPLQALVLLNDPVYVEAAKMLGVRMLKEGGKTDESKITLGFKLVVSRKPTQAEIDIVKAYLESERLAFKADAKAAKDLLGVGEAKVDEKFDPAEAAAWTQVGSTILNMDAALRRG